ncbi:hypothetical protein [Streptomyces sp. Isolate_45]|uniref:hypothetical protein n=1 Tax=Streptomyces sp. Isolate_45 TaxID=2950111 RepID=UPI00248204B7|nr:hypothetical protein [Streptomyces sp. Isolate_45]MDA5284454.1 hypothetical protein [Streptomyces sp. Isolate_45]
MGRLFRAGLAAGTALVLSACGGGSENAGGGANSGEAPAGEKEATAPLAGKGTISVAFCRTIRGADNRNIYGLTVRSYALKDGALVAERNSVMDPGFKPLTICDEGERPAPWRAFNKNLTMVAGLAAPSRAGAADTTTGKEIAPPDKDAFVKDLRTGAVAFHPVTGQLWYDSDGGESLVYVRDPKGGMATEKPVKAIADHIAKDPVTAAAILSLGQSDVVAVSPSGVIAMTGSLGKLDRQPTNGGVRSFFQEFPVQGLSGNNQRDCYPAFWRDDTTLVCDYSLEQITFSADHKSVVTRISLLPDADRTVQDPLLSPDGKSIAFIARNGAGQDVIYKIDPSTPGSQPVKIAELEKPMDGSDKHKLSLITWN